MLELRAEENRFSGTSAQPALLNQLRNNRPRVLFQCSAERLNGHRALSKRTQPTNAERRLVRHVAKAGRPTETYSVRLKVTDKDRSKPQKASFRSAVLKSVQEAPNHFITLDALVAQHGAKARGAVSKLVVAGWLERVKG